MMAATKMSAKRHIMTGLVVLFILVAGLGTWMAAARIDGAIVTQGVLEIGQNQQVVQHPDGGVIDRILVNDGDKVRSGDVLVQLDRSELTSQLAIIESQYFAQLARIARLTAERDRLAQVEYPRELLDALVDHPSLERLAEGQNRLFRSRQKTLAMQQSQLSKREVQIEQKVLGIEAQHKAFTKQLELIQLELKDQRRLLDKGLTQASHVLGLKREEASVLGKIGELAAARAEASEKITETRIQSLGLAVNLREQAISELRDLHATTFELAEMRRLLLQRSSGLDIRAPISGTIHNRQVHAPRSVLRPADPVLYIVPTDRKLSVVAPISLDDIDQLALGQAVTLRFTAFDDLETSNLETTVAKISADAFTNDASGVGYYEAEFSIPDDNIDAPTEGLDLWPGMSVTAFIKTGSRSPMSYLLEPLTRYFSRAFRES